MSKELISARAASVIRQKIRLFRGGIETSQFVRELCLDDGGQSGVR